eukprot:284926_1
MKHSIQDAEIFGILERMNWSLGVPPISPSLHQIPDDMLESVCSPKSLAESLSDAKATDFQISSERFFKLAIPPFSRGSFASFQRSPTSHGSPKRTRNEPTVSKPDPPSTPKEALIHDPSRVHNTRSKSKSSHDSHAERYNPTDMSAVNMNDDNTYTTETSTSSHHQKWPWMPQLRRICRTSRKCSVT